MLRVRRQAARRPRPSPLQKRKQARPRLAPSPTAPGGAEAVQESESISARAHTSLLTRYLGLMEDRCLPEDPGGPAPPPLIRLSQKAGHGPGWAGYVRLKQGPPVCPQSLMGIVKRGVGLGVQWELSGWGVRGTDLPRRLYGLEIIHF